MMLGGGSNKYARSSLSAQPTSSSPYSSTAPSQPQHHVFFAGSPSPSSSSTAATNTQAYHNQSNLQQQQQHQQQQSIPTNSHSTATTSSMHQLLRGSTTSKSTNSNVSPSARNSTPVGLQKSYNSINNSIQQQQQQQQLLLQQQQQQQTSFRSKANNQQVHSNSKESKTQQQLQQPILRFPAASTNSSEETSSKFDSKKQVGSATAQQSNQQHFLKEQSAKDDQQQQQQSTASMNKSNSRISPLSPKLPQPIDLQLFNSASSISAATGPPATPSASKSLGEYSILAHSSKSHNPTTNLLNSTSTSTVCKINLRGENTSGSLESFKVQQQQQQSNQSSLSSSQQQSQIPRVSLPSSQTNRTPTNTRVLTGSSPDSLKNYASIQTPSKSSATTTSSLATYLKASQSITTAPVGITTTATTPSSSSQVQLPQSLISPTTTSNKHLQTSSTTTGLSHFKSSSSATPNSNGLATSSYSIKQSIALENITKKHASTGSGLQGTAATSPPNTSNTPNNTNVLLSNNGILNKSLSNNQHHHSAVGSMTTLTNNNNNNLNHAITTTANSNNLIPQNSQSPSIIPSKLSLDSAMLPSSSKHIMKTLPAEETNTRSTSNKQSNSLLSNSHNSNSQFSSLRGTGSTIGYNTSSSSFLYASSLKSQQQQQQQRTASEEPAGVSNSYSQRTKVTNKQPAVTVSAAVPSQNQEYPHKNHHKQTPPQMVGLKSTVTPVVSVASNAQTSSIPASVGTAAAAVDGENTIVSSKGEGVIQEKLRRLEAFEGHLSGVRSSFESVLQSLGAKKDACLSEYHEQISSVESVQQRLVNLINSAAKSRKDVLMDTFNASLASCTHSIFDVSQVLNYIACTQNDLTQNLPSILHDMDMPSLDDIINQYTSILANYQAVRDKNLSNLAFTKWNLIGIRDSEHTSISAIQHALDNLFKAESTVYYLNNISSNAQIENSYESIDISKKEPNIYVSFENSDIFQSGANGILSSAGGESVKSTPVMRGMHEGNNKNENNFNISATAVTTSKGIATATSTGASPSWDSEWLKGLQHFEKQQQSPPMHVISVELLHQSSKKESSGNSSTAPTGSQQQQNNYLELDVIQDDPDRISFAPKSTADFFMNDQCCSAEQLVGAKTEARQPQVYSANPTINPILNQLQQIQTQQQINTGTTDGKVRNSSTSDSFKDQLPSASSSFQGSLSASGLKSKQKYNDLISKIQVRQSQTEKFCTDVLSGSGIPTGSFRYSIVSDEATKN